jgi:hypothetical protein
MKKLILFTVLILSNLTFAQGNSVEKQRFTPEQQTELQLKKMTLNLDLNAKQQLQVKSILLDKVKNREVRIAALKNSKDKGKKLSADEKFELKSKMLDEQIALKGQMKQVLNAAQFNKWESNKEKRAKKMKQRRYKRETNPIVKQ